MKKYDFLILGKNQPILEILLRLVNANENWNAVGFNDEKLAQDYFLLNNRSVTYYADIVTVHFQGRLHKIQR